MNDETVKFLLHDLNEAQFPAANIHVAPDNAVALYPRCKEDLQTIVRYARERKTALRPGSSAVVTDYLRECADGGIIVDMTRMSSIRKIDEYSRYAWIEAGVTFGELLPELAKHGLKLNHPLSPLASKSVVTSILEREPVIMPKYQYDNVDPLHTAEVVYGTGDDFRTGSASGPGSLETLKADKVNPWGPGPVDFVRFLSGAQGTMGIVTWAVVKTEIAPTIQKLFLVSSDEIGPLMDMLAGLLRGRAVDECLILDRINMALITGIKDVSHLQEYTLVCQVSGYRRYPEERIHIQEGYLRKFCEQHGLSPAETFSGGENIESALNKILNGCGETSWKSQLCGGYKDIFFLAPISKVRGLVNVMLQTAAECGFPEDRLGIYVQPGVQGRSSHVEFTVYFDPESAEMTSAAESLFLDASRKLIDAGAYFSRPYGMWADMVYSRDPVGTRMLKKMKAIFDPDGILNPGTLCF